MPLQELEHKAHVVGDALAAMQAEEEAKSDALSEVRRLHAALDRAQARLQAPLV